MAPKNPKTVTIYGRLSFPTWTAKEAYDKSQKGNYPAKDLASAKPDFTLLVEDKQLQKLKDHVVKEFLPYCIEQEKKGEKKDVLSDKEAKQLIEQLNDPAFDGPYNTPFKPVGEKTAPLCPEAVAAVKLIGTAGVDIELKAIVNNEDELLVPDPDLIFPPAKILPIGQTVHSMYAGCYVAATINLYAYHNGKLPGFSAGVNVAVFKADGDRFGGGVTIDEDEIFAD